MPKIFAHFDHAGKIRSMVSYDNAPKGISLALTAAPGEQVAELDAQALGVTKIDADKLHEIAREHAIGDPIMRRALVKKP